MNLKYLWVIMVSISITLFLFQVSAEEINKDSNTLYNIEGSLISSYNSGNYTLKQNVSENIPELSGEITTESDNGFTDIFQSIKSWFQETKSGKIIGGLYYAVPNILQGIGLPDAFAFALGVMWTLFSVFSFVLFLRGII